jgi:hypothetical protein
MTDNEKILLDHGLELFKMHAKQRMDGFRHYLIATAIFFAALAQMWTKGEYAICAVLSALLFIINLGFYVLDRRALELVHHSEELLAVVHQKLKEAVTWTEEEKNKILFLEESNNESYLINCNRGRFLQISYRSVFWKLFHIMGVLAIICFIFSIWHSFGTTPAPPGIPTN